MKRMDSAPTAGHEESRSILLMNYDTRCHDLKKCQVKRISQPQLICLSVTTGREMDSTHFVFYPLVCHVVEEEFFFLLGLLITKKNQQNKYFLRTNKKC